MPPPHSRKGAARPAPNVHQQAVLNTVSGGSRIVVINAFAGTGKTATLELVARQMKASDNRRVHYLVFNQKNAQEARRRMPDNTTVTTAHGLAWRAPHPDTGEPMQRFFSVSAVQRIPGSGTGLRTGTSGMSRPSTRR